jgi:hypothetical protein
MQPTDRVSGLSDLTADHELQQGEDAQRDGQQAHQAGDMVIALEIERGEGIS